MNCAAFKAHSNNSYTDHYTIEHATWEIRTYNCGCAVYFKDDTSFTLLSRLYKAVYPAMNSTLYTEWGESGTEKSRTRNIFIKVV